MAFGSAIKKLREDAGISVEKLTAKIGVSSSRWRKWEEKDFDPRDEDQEAIERYFGMNLLEISKLDSIKGFLKVPNSFPGDTTGAGGPTPMQILDRLSQAFVDQAAAFRAQAEMMKSIESKMARESTQATIAEKVKASEASLWDIRKDVTKLVQRQELAIEEIREQFLKLQVRRTDPSPDVRKKRGQTDGND